MSVSPYYAVGDLQGCLDSLEDLLAILPENAHLLFLGDLVNRGPNNIGVLRRIRELGSRASFLLGNHDLHLLAIAAGYGRVHRKDTIIDIVHSDTYAEWVDFLRHGRLAIMHAGVLCVHAGVHPTWTAEDTLAYAGEIEAMLHSDNWRDVFINMYGPRDFDPALQGSERRQAIMNALTRIRYVDSRTGAMDFDNKGALHTAEKWLVPWFEYKARRCKDTPICFGHWSTLGLINTPKVMAVDTGCLWGGRLSAISLPEREVVSVPCPPWANYKEYGKQNPS